MKNQLKFTVIVLCSLISFSSFAQDDDYARLSIHRLSLGMSLNAGKFYLEGNENGRELVDADLNRHENSTRSSSFGIGVSVNYRFNEQFDILYDRSAELSTELVVDTYWINSRNFGVKYRPISFNNFSPFGQLTYSIYDVGAISVIDVTRTSQNKHGQYVYYGKGLTFHLGAELKMNRLFYSLSYNKLFTIGNIAAKEGGVEFENNPKHHYFQFGVRLAL